MHYLNSFGDEIIVPSSYVQVSGWDSSMYSKLTLPSPQIFSDSEMTRLNTGDGYALTTPSDCTVCHGSPAN